MVYQCRTAAVTTAAAFTAAIHTYCEIGIFFALEARSQARTKESIANVTQQITLLKNSHSPKAKIIEHYLSLISISVH
ncbi:hypothetical protein AS132_23915 [Photobacterium sanguinicancri]|nr:hypothetical protein AS132_23915 [Photobacterium sanguinicancri]